jgi:tRNA A37 methylthiotransferase MiaB
VVHIQGFSPRPRTTAALHPDDVSPPEKKRRINVLLEVQRRIAEDANRRWLGHTVEVLVERAEDGELTGRTRQNRVIIGSAPLGGQTGTVRRVYVEQATAWQLRGQVLD